MVHTISSGTFVLRFWYNDMLARKNRGHASWATLTGSTRMLFQVIATDERVALQAYTDGGFAEGTTTICIDTARRHRSILFEGGELVDNISSWFGECRVRARAIEALLVLAQTVSAVEALARLNADLFTACVFL